MMRSAAALAVLLLGSISACSSDDDGNALTVLPRGEGRLPQTRYDLESSLDRLNDFEPDVQVLDITDWEDRVGSSGLDRPTPCIIPLTAMQSWADAHLSCGMCFALICSGDAYAHVCTHQCDSTGEPDGDDNSPLI
jgi:hypothetical protein